MDGTDAAMILPAGCPDSPDSPRRRIQETDRETCCPQSHRRTARTGGHDVGVCILIHCM